MGNLLNANNGTRGMLPALLLAAALAGCSGGANNTAGGSDAGIAVATAAMSAGSPRVALQVTQGILDRAPDNVPALIVRGDALTQLNQNDEAIVAYEAALRKDPHSVGGNLGLGRLRLATDPAAAATMFREVLAAEPNNIHALTNLGVALDLLGDHVAAQSDYHRALNNDPNDQGVQVNLALSLAMSGDSAGALRLIEPIARDKGASTKVRHNYAAILTMAGRRADAAKLLKDDLSPEDTNRAIAAYAEGTRLAPRTPNRDEPPPVVAAGPAPSAPAPAPVAQAAPAPAPVTAPVVQPPAPVAQAAPPAARPTETVVVTQTSAPLTSIPAAANETPVVAPASASPAPVTSAPAAQTTTPAAPSPAAVATATPTTPPATPSDAETEIGPHVQLGAFNSESAARDEWSRLQAKLPNLFSDREPAITTVVRDGKTFWRLRTWGFPDQAAARGFCSEIRSATPRCMVFGA